MKYFLYIALMMCTQVMAQSPNDYCRANNISIDKCSPTSSNSGFNVSRSQYEDSRSGSYGYDHNRYQRDPNQYSLEQHNRYNRYNRYPQTNIQLGVHTNNMNVRINTNR